jgi:hypothetical protein
MITFIGVVMITMASIGLFFMIWAGIASVLFPWADRMRDRSSR